MRYAAALIIAGSMIAQQQMTIEEYEPKSGLTVAQHPKERAKYAFIDIHNHQGLMSPVEVDKLVHDMDSINMRIMVNLSGGYGDRLKQMVQSLKGRYPERFAVFANVNFSGIDEPGWGDRAAKQLEEDVRNGAQGLKFFKNFGMDVKDKNGRVHVDDPRLDPIFETCARLKLPVLIHTAEPKQFFDPIDKYNERWLELKQIPGRARPPDRYPSWETLMTEQHNLFARHPKTIFIAAHLDWLGGNLAELSRLMDQLPNMYTELGAVLAEIGRQPRTGREFFIKYQDRILMGKDSWNPTEYQTYFRVFETADEYFDYYRKRHAFWKMYGLDLPDDVLKKVYYKNALHIVPGLPSDGWPK
jgi:predicted TIM-barrel fold metal-dependent hydrolase